jgi:hypothetical protein
MDSTYYAQAHNGGCPCLWAGASPAPTPIFIIRGIGVPTMNEFQNSLNRATLCS